MSKENKCWWIFFHKWEDYPEGCQDYSMYKPIKCKKCGKIEVTIR